jgi:hypothetical protein
VDSIAGPGSKVWDYDLSYNNNDVAGKQTDTTLMKGQVYESVLDARGKGLHSRDLIMVEPGRDDNRLSHVFKAIEQFGAAYTIIHYAPCRVVFNDGKDVYGPMQLADMANRKMMGSDQSVLDITRGSTGLAASDEGMVVSGLID